MPVRTTVELPPTVAKPNDRPATAAKPAPKLALEKPGLAAAHERKTEASAHLAKLPAHEAKKSVDKKAVVTAKALTKSLRVAKVDPLAPLPAHHSGNSKGIAAER